MPISFDIKLKEKDLYRFQIKQAYKGMQGWLALVIAAIAFGLCIYSYGNERFGAKYTIMYLVFGVIFLFYVPFNLRMQTKRQFLMSAAFKGVMHYEITDEGVTLTAGGEQATMTWEQVYMITADKSSIYVYTSKIYAYIIPRAQISNQYAEIMAAFRSHLAETRIAEK